MLTDTESDDRILADEDHRSREFEKLDSAAQRVLAKMRARMKWSRWRSDAGIRRIVKKTDGRKP